MPQHCGSELGNTGPCSAATLFDNKARTARAGESSSEYWTSLGALTDEPRYILAKRPGIPERRNLEQQRRSLEEGVVFHWLIYDSPGAREMWPKYLHELRAMGISDERLRAQLQCRLIPAALSLRAIDWRISIFGDQIALCSYDPDHAVGLAAAQTFTLDSPAELKDKFGALFDACPPLEPPVASSVPAEVDRLRAAHAALKMAFLRSFKQGLPTDIMLHRLEDAAESSNIMLDQTRLLIWIGVLTLVAVIVTFAITELKLA